MSVTTPLPIHEVRAVVNDNTVELSILGNQETLTVDTYGDVRKEIMGRVVILVGGLGSDVRLVVHDQTGQWRLVAQPDRQLREDDLEPSASYDLPAHPTPDAVAVEPARGAPGSYFGTPDRNRPRHSRGGAFEGCDSGSCGGGNCGGGSAKGRRHARFVHHQ